MIEVISWLILIGIVVLIIYDSWSRREDIH